MEMKTLLTLLITELITNSPDAIDYAWVYEMLSILEEEENKVKTKIKSTIQDAHKVNYDMELDFSRSNLKEIGVTAKVPNPSYAKVKSKKIDKLVDKQFKKFDSKIKNQILNSLNTSDIGGVQRILETMLKHEKKTQSIVSNLMRVFRTESTDMRSRFKMELQENLLAEGIKVKRRWLHTMFNSRNVILDNYTPRGDHLAMNGQLEDSLGYFHSPNGAVTKAPGMFGLPEEDINCRCDVDFVLDE